MTIETKKIEIESELLNKICEIAKDNNTTENKVLNDFIKKGIEDTEKSKVKTIVQNNPKLKLLEKELNENNKRISLFDCVYIALMKELGIKKIISFDKHFDNQERITRIE